MTRSRDALVAAMAAVAVLALGVGVAVLIVDARSHGRDALEELQTEQVEQLADSMEARVAAAYSALVGVAAGPWTLAPGDPGDRERVEDVVADPDARTGVVLVDSSGTVTNGALLGPTRVGDEVTRPGIEEALADTRPSILPVAPGITTSVPTLAVVLPVQGSASTGAVIFEVEVSAESAFNAEVAELGRGETGTFAFVDGLGTVVASSDRGLLGRAFGRPSLIRGPVGFRTLDDQVAAVAEVPSAGWRAVFIQDASEFERDLGGRIQAALVLLLTLAGLVAALLFGVLLWRLRRAREESTRLRQIAEAQEEFVSIVSHELRTPVTGVSGFLQTAIDHWSSMDDVDRRRAVTRALASARRLQSLTRDVLDSASLEAGDLTYQLAAVDLVDEVDAAVSAARDLYPDQTVDLRRPPDAVWVRGDGERIQQVLANLIDNAVKHSPAGAPVTVSVTDDGAGPQVAVTDRGPGIVAADADRVFDKFVRGRRESTRGTGLGLYICRRIVEAHGGRIRAEAGDDGRGATFSFSLPSGPDPEPSPERVS